MSYASEVTLQRGLQLRYVITNGASLKRNSIKGTLSMALLCCATKMGISFKWHVKFEVLPIDEPAHGERVLTSKFSKLKCYFF